MNIFSPLSISESRSMSYFWPKCKMNLVLLLPKVQSEHIFTFFPKWKPTCASFARSAMWTPVVLLDEVQNGPVSIFLPEVQSAPMSYFCPFKVNIYSPFCPKWNPTYVILLPEVWSGSMSIFFASIYLLINSLWFLSNKTCIRR